MFPLPQSCQHTHIHTQMRQSVCAILRTTLTQLVFSLLPGGISAWQLVFLPALMRGIAPNVKP